MQVSFGRRFHTWLALAPATVSLVLTTGAMAQDKGQASAVHRQVSAAEAQVTKAISAKDSKSLSRIGSELGRIIEAALARRETGGEVSSCDMAAHSLAFVAVSAADGLISKGEARKLLLADASTAASDFQKDMQTCEKQAGKSSGSHTSIGKALRAL
ncbi:hypothetical protein IP76_10835 [Rhizobium sp. AAP43]|nr:hypothetical protein IP76_10835 [Rhizobium sp. AAP43]